MNRLGLLHPSELSEQSKALYDSMRKLATNAGPLDGNLELAITKDDRLIGVCGALLHTPTVGGISQAMIEALPSLPGLTARDREIAILTTGAKFDAEFEIYVHKVMAERNGISSQDIDDILKGKIPETLDKKGLLVYELAYELVSKQGPLSQTVWDRAVEHLTREGAVAVIHYVAYYSYLSVLLNAFDCKAPNSAQMD